MWYAGIDWSDTHHDVIVIDDAGSQVVSKRVSHTKAGLDLLISVDLARKDGDSKRS